MKLLNKTSYNEVIIKQEYMACFQIVDETKMKDNKYGNSRQAWMKLSRIFWSNARVSDASIYKKFDEF